MARDVLVLQYRRRLADGGKVSGQVVFVDDDGNVLFEVCSFNQVGHADMIELYSRAVIANPDARCCFQRIDQPGFPITDWSGPDIEQMRNDPAKAIEDLSAIRQVTYDMRAKTEEE